MGLQSIISATLSFLFGLPQKKLVELIDSLPLWDTNSRIIEDILQIATGARSNRSKTRKEILHELSKGDYNK
jgi:hypothetical protein